jgi:hypothetical protein
VRECPRSLITAESAARVERFFLWTAGGSRMNFRMGARDAEAMLVLKQEFEKEKRDDDRRGAE